MLTFSFCTCVDHPSWQTWAREFLTAYDIMTQKDKPDIFRVNTLLISLAETWPTYFGASWPIQVPARKVRS